jgi:hypothetical protein
MQAMPITHWLLLNVGLVARGGTPPLKGFFNGLVTSDEVLGHEGVVVVAREGYPIPGLGVTWEVGAGDGFMGEKTVAAYVLGVAFRGLREDVREDQGRKPVTLRY